MTERELQTAVIETARLLGWRVAHFRPAQTGRGWRTPVEADGAGYPDLTLVRKGHLIFAELKADKGVIAPAQHAWLDDLGHVSVGVDRVQVYIWRPVNWVNGDIERELRYTGTARDMAA